MKKEERQPSWAQIFVCFVVAILAFWFVFNVTDLLMSQITPKTDWQINITVFLYMVVLGSEIFGSVKLYEYLIKKSIETAEKYEEKTEEEK